MDAADDQHVVDIADQILLVCGDCPHAAKDKAACLMNLGNFASAQPLLDDLLAGDLRGHRADVLDMRGVVAAESEGPEEALVYLREAVRLDPEGHQTNCHLAAALSQLERYEEVLPFATKAVETNPDEERGLNFLIIALAETGDRDGVVGRVGSPENCPFNDATRGNFARALRRVGEPHLALEWLTELLERNPESVDATCLSASTYIGIGEMDEALTLFNKLKILDPDSHLVPAALSIARIESDRDNWAVALRELVEARVAFPDDGDVEEYMEQTLSAMTGTIEERESERERWRARFEALDGEHRSLQRAVQILVSGSGPGLPLGVARVEGEGQTIEFMQSFPKNTRELAREIAAFATSNDGNIFIGVNDDCEVVGLEDVDDVSSRDTMMNRVGGIASSGVSPAAKVDAAFIPFENQTVLRIFVPKGDEPVYFAGNVPYLRHLEKSRPAEPHEVDRLYRPTSP